MSFLVRFEGLGEGGERRAERGIAGVVRVVGWPGWSDRSDKSDKSDESEGVGLVRELELAPENAKITNYYPKFKRPGSF